MGVRGLSRLVKLNGLLEEFQLPKLPKYKNNRKTRTPPPIKLVIDGWSFLYTFYQQTMNCAIGGQYTEFRILLKQFFTHLLSYNVIICGVILDWLSADIQFRKHSIQRILSHHLSASELIHLPEKLDENCKKEIINEDLPLPFLSFITFVNTLKEMKIHCFITKGIGDKTIASFANQKNAFVLANDSDYMIYPLKMGYILLKHLDLIHGRTFLFRISSLSKFFNLPIPILPLYAIVMGTSYHRETLQDLFMDLDWCNSILFSPCIVQLLQSLKHLTLEKATLDLLAERCEKHGIENHSAWIRLFQKLLSIYEIDLKEVTNNSLDDPSDPYGFLMRVHSDHYFYCFSLWEDYTKPSAWHFSRPLRSFSYTHFCPQVKKVHERVRTLNKDEFAEVIVQVSKTTSSTLNEALEQEKDAIVFTLSYLKDHKQLTMTQLLAVALARHVPFPPSGQIHTRIHPSLYHFVALFETTLVSWSMATGQPLSHIVDGASIFHFFHALWDLEIKGIWFAIHQLAPSHLSKVIHLLEQILGFELDTRKLVKNGIHWKLRKGKAIKK